MQNQEKKEEKKLFAYAVMFFDFVYFCFLDLLFCFSFFMLLCFADVFFVINKVIIRY